MKSKLIGILTSKKTKYVVSAIVILAAYYGLKTEMPKRLVAINNSIKLPKEILDNPEIIGQVIDKVQEVDSKLGTIHDIIF